MEAVRMSLKTGAARDLPGQTVPVFAAWPRKPVSAGLASHPPVAGRLFSVPAVGPQPTASWRVEDACEEDQ